MEKYLILALSLLSFTSFAEGASREEIVKKFLEQRERIMNDMMKGFDDDSFNLGGPAFDDSLIKKFDKHFFGQNRFASSVTIQKRIMDNGDIKVIITPKSESIKLDIKTDDNKITVSSQTLIEQEDKSQTGNSFMKSSSSSSQSIAIPLGYKVSGPTKEAKSIIYFFKKVATGKRPVKVDHKGKTI